MCLQNCLFEIIVCFLLGFVGSVAVVQHYVNQCPLEWVIPKKRESTTTWNNFHVYYQYLYFNTLESWLNLVSEVLSISTDCVTTHWDKSLWLDCEWAYWATKQNHQLYEDTTPTFQLMRICLLSHVSSEFSLLNFSRF